jgi:hypothetical protein
MSSRMSFESADTSISSTAEGIVLEGPEWERKSELEPREAPST